MNAERKDMPEKRRIAAIVGRPNVGKSAVFNRLAGRRLAIVHEESGVTRDRLMREVAWRGRRFHLVDTGGLYGRPDETAVEAVSAGTRAQAEIALRDASVALLVTDGSAGRHPLDEEVASLLRAQGLPTLVLVNKCDVSAHDNLAGDFARLGFEVFPVSALHDRGFAEPMRRLLAQLPPEQDSTVENPLRVAFVGRPNVGKSSLVNALLEEERVIVSEMPGTTRESIDVPFTIDAGDAPRHYVLVDNAGMRKMGRIDSAVERYGHFRAEKSIQRADVAVLVMDSARGPTAYEKRIASTILEARRGCVLVLNKWDLLEEETSFREAADALFEAMPFMAHCPLVCLSAQTGFNVREVVAAIDRVAANLVTELPTGILNRVIGRAFQESPPPRLRGRPLKIFYATQTGVRPPRITLFVNDPARARPNYSDYLVRRLRENFSLEGVFVDVKYKARREPRRPGTSRKGGDEPRPSRRKERKR